MSRLTHGARVLSAAGLTLLSAAALTLVAVAALTLMSATTLTAGQSQTLTVTGRVIDAGSGAPIAGAVVEVRIGSRRQGTPAMTGRSGEFRLTDVPASSTMRAVIVASKAGYFGGGADQERPGALRQAFVLEADLFDLTLRLWQTGSISGRVVDSTGAPLPNVFVRAVEDGPPDVSRENRISAGARTDDRGVYEISPVLPETYRVFVHVDHVTQPTVNTSRMVPPGSWTARAAATSEDGMFYLQSDPGGNTATAPGTADDRDAVFLTTSYPNAASQALATPVTVGSGQRRTNIDITMLSAPRVQIRGRVLTPLPSTWRPVLQLVDPYDDAAPAEPVAFARSHDGLFAFLSAPPGDWLLEVYREATHTDVAVADPDGLTARIPVSVGDQNIDDLEIVLQPGVTVSARLEFEGPAPVACHSSPLSSAPRT